VETVELPSWESGSDKAAERVAEALFDAAVGPDDDGDEGAVGAGFVEGGLAGFDVALIVGEAFGPAWLFRVCGACDQSRAARIPTTSVAIATGPKSGRLRIADGLFPTGRFTTRTRGRLRGFCGT
jgi:hypothetical protein